MILPIQIEYHRRFINYTTLLLSIRIALDPFVVALACNAEVRLCVAGIPSVYITLDPLIIALASNAEVRLCVAGIPSFHVSLDPFVVALASNAEVGLSVASIPSVDITLDPFVVALTSNAEVGFSGPGVSGHLCSWQCDCSADKGRDKCNGKGLHVDI